MVFIFGELIGEIHPYDGTWNDIPWTSYRYTLCNKATPTYDTAYSCGANTQCYYADLSPEIGKETSQWVVTSTPVELTVSTEIISIDITGDYDCISPELSIMFENIDMDESSIEYFDVLDDDGSTITRCSGGYKNMCGHWTYCINSHSLYHNYSYI